MKRKRILIVDDEIGATRMLKANLELMDRYEVQVENRPEHAVPVARRFRPDAVLLDIVMPSMSGTAIAKELLGDPDLKSVPIAFLTAADKGLLPPDAAAALDSVPRIEKPATLKKILRFLEANLSVATIPGTNATDAPPELHGGNNE
jgi:DNA-binding response OmpR family regulator